MDLDETIEFADSLMASEKWSECVAFLEEDPELVDTDYRLCWTLGWAYFKLQEYRDAKRLLLHAADLAPHEYATHWALGSVYLELGEFDSAEKSLKTALVIRDTAVARLTLAVVYLEQGRLKEAEKVHLDGIEIDPDSAERWEAYADFLSDAGREPEAIAAQTKADHLRTT